MPQTEAFLAPQRSLHRSHEMTQGLSLPFLSEPGSSLASLSAEAPSCIISGPEAPALCPSGLLRMPTLYSLSSSSVALTATHPHPPPPRKRHVVFPPALLSSFRGCWEFFGSRRWFGGHGSLQVLMRAHRAGSRSLTTPFPTILGNRWIPTANRLPAGERGVFCVAPKVPETSVLC